ncbi:hypothetical protein [Streptomyces californicus]|uniref:hypothetical protein n=1 Tax=Streptomyces californicus TaxID=67351 RepID=UPI0004C1DC45|nr:hypothetical protein [Streptomyces californicus]QRV53467.1 hypothetical protein I6J40_04100 [Streptomyces californicus]
MNDREITDLWVEIARDIGPSSATAVQRLMAGMAERQEQRLREQIADEIDDRGYELRSSDDGISREEWGCYGEAAEIARKGVASVRDE